MATESINSKPSITIGVARGDALCDTIVKCQGEEYPVHRLVLSASSPVFQRALSGAFKECSTGTYVIKESNAVAVNKLLDFIYYKSYDIKEFARQQDSVVTVDKGYKCTQVVSAGTDTRDARYIEALQSTQHLVVELDLIEAAEIYMIDGLADYAIGKIADALHNHWTSEGFCRVLQECHDKLSGPMSRLRAILIDAGARNASELVRSDGFVTLRKVPYLFWCDLWTRVYRNNAARFEAATDKLGFMLEASLLSSKLGVRIGVSALKEVLNNQLRSASKGY